MGGYLIQNGPTVGHWVAQRLGATFHETASEAIGLVREGQVVAGVIYENFNGASIMAHIAVEGPISRGFLSAIFDYPYRVCRVLKVICPVPRANTRSARLAEHMGFTPEAVLSDCHPDGDIILYTLRNTDCRFLTGRFSLDGQIRPQAAAGA